MQLVTNISKSTAQRMIQHVREVRNIPKPRIVFVRDFCDYYGVPLDSQKHQ